MPPNQKLQQIMSINQYKIIKKVGKGNFATVYKAQDKNTERIVAIKIFSRKLTEVEEQLASKEVAMLKKVDHQNIIHLYSQFKKNDTWYMIFEFCGKGDLDHLLAKRKGRLDEQTTSLIVVPLVEALAQLQKSNIAHRDIKLANILVTDEFEIKLADLGFAKAAQGEELLQSYAGSPIIMAPEIFEHGRYTNKCDIWSLGVVIYQMLFGHAPFMPNRGGTIEDLAYLVKNKYVEFPKDVPVSPEAKDFISRCLQKHPEKRISADVMKKHPWILKAKQANADLAKVLEQLYSLNSGIFNAVIEDEQKYDEFDEKIMLEKELNDGIKRTLDYFVVSYRQRVETFKKSYKELKKFAADRSKNENLLNYIHSIMMEKISEMENLKVEILLPGQTINLGVDSIKESKIAADHLKKFVPLGFEFNGKNCEKELVRMVTSLLQEFYQEISGDQRSEILKSLWAFIITSFQHYKIDFNINVDLSPEVFKLAEDSIKRFDKNLIDKMLPMKRQETIPLMDVIDAQITMPEAEIDPKLAFILKALKSCENNR